MKNKLLTLADKYETKDFLKEDPSQFLYYYKSVRDTELCAFTASLLSFGSRKQFIPKIRFIMENADNFGGIYKWITCGIYKKTFAPGDNKKFYRFYSYEDFNILFSRLEEILDKEKTFGAFLKKEYYSEVKMHLAQGDNKCAQSGAVFKDKRRAQSDSDFKSTVRAQSSADLLSTVRAGSNTVFLVDVLSQIFTGCSIVPSTKSSAKKRLCMFLRWMVRDNSPVDLGLWSWYSKSDLIIPLDVHVLEEAKKLKLISDNAGATRKTAELLSQKAKKYFPDDPCRLDFALFGLGVDKE